MSAKNLTSAVSVVLVNYGNTHDTLKCVDSLLNTGYLISKIIVIDNSDSVDAALEPALHQRRGVQYICPGRNLGFAGGCNRGAQEALKDGPGYVLLLNNDTIVKDDFLKRLLEGADTSKADLATGKIYYLDKPKTIWGAGGRIDWKKGMGIFYGTNEEDPGRYNEPREISFISGCLMLVKADVFQKIGFLDEKYFMYCEDVDYCLRASKAGLKLWYAPEAVIWHKVGATVSSKTPFLFYYFIRNSLFIVKRHAGWTRGLLYAVYAPFYYLYKLVLVFLRDVRFVPAYFFGFFDGILGNGGPKDYGFLKKR